MEAEWKDQITIKDTTMSIWAKIAKYGGSPESALGSVAKQRTEICKQYGCASHKALKGAGSAMKTAAM